MSDKEKTSVLFVCLGNICRSPTAEGVFRHRATEHGVSSAIHIDSAGTSAWHVGESPDQRSTEAALRRGVVLAGASRKATKQDFARFDYIIAMDASNYRNLLDLAPNDEAKSRVHMFRDFDPDSDEGSEVPDPYYGGDSGFDDVFDICDAAAEGLIRHLESEHGL